MHSCFAILLSIRMKLWLLILLPKRGLILRYLFHDFAVPLPWILMHDLPFSRAITKLFQHCKVDAKILVHDLIIIFSTNGYVQCWFHIG